MSDAAIGAFFWLLMMGGVLGIALLYNPRPNLTQTDRTRSFHDQCHTCRKHLFERDEKVFDPGAPLDPAFCSIECRDKARRRVCRWCWADIEAEPNAVSNRDGRWFCGLRHRAQWAEG
jgi:hypothetical protein